MVSLKHDFEFKQKISFPPTFKFFLWQANQNIANFPLFPMKNPGILNV